MKVLMLNYEFPPLGGGSGNANYYILRELASYLDLQIDLVTSSSGTFRVEQFSGNTRIHFMDIQKNEKSLHYQSNRDLLLYACKAFMYARKLIECERYNLVHAFFGIPCGYMAMKLGLPYLVSLRGSDVAFYNRRFYWPDRLIFKRLSKNIWRKARKVIANSGGLKELAGAAAPGQEIAVICNGVDLEDFFPREQNNKRIDQKLKLISVGRLIERKGYRYLIEALKDMKNVELMLIGEGNLRGELEDLAVKNRVNLTFAGKVKHEYIGELICEADVFVLPSLNEGMSNSVLEAMACGLPVIATDTGGSEELVKGNGFIVKKGDIHGLRKAVERFWANPGLINEMGIISRDIAQSMSWGEVAASYYKIYKNII